MARGRSGNNNVAVALVLSFMLFLIFQQYMAPKAPPVVSDTKKNVEDSFDSKDEEARSKGTQELKVLEIEGESGDTTAYRSVSEAVIRDEKNLFKVKTHLAEYTFSRQGGRLVQVSLSDYMDSIESKGRLNMLSEYSFLGIEFGESDIFDDSGVLYDVEGIPSTALVGEPTKLLFNGSLGKAKFKKLVTLFPDSYRFDIKITSNLKDSDLSLILNFPESELSGDSTDAGTLMFLKDGSRESLYSGVNKSIGEASWLVVGKRYFANGIVNIGSNSLQALTNKDSSLTVKASGKEIEQGVYIGPRQKKALARAEESLQRAIDLGWFVILAEPLVQLLNLFYSFIGNYGLSIVLLTLLIKVLFYPLNKASLRSMAKMQEIAPELQKLKDKKLPPAEMQAQMMSIYKNNGVNPLGGCLPVLIQIPVFLGLYNALLQSIELRHASFALWINDLSSPEKLMLFGFPVPLMVILMGVSMYAQQVLQPQTSMDPQQQRVMKFMPLIFAGMFIIFPMPAGLVLYWLINNIMSIAQQVYIKGHVKGDPFIATVVTSLIIFGISFVLTLI